MKGYSFLVDSKTARIADRYAKSESITLEQAMRQFLASLTYRALSIPETGLYLEVFEYVYDMFIEERNE
ncbi:MAG: hypothetical protein FWG87_00655 [Defluviitaleaceae bacterium]|nr:hypothetical protein [Defluviitaleaceae bacterium]